jgi:hypothetical protein
MTPELPEDARVRTEDGDTPDDAALLAAEGAVPGGTTRTPAEWPGRQPTSPQRHDPRVVRLRSLDTEATQGPFTCDDAGVYVVADLVEDERWPGEPVQRPDEMEVAQCYKPDKHSADAALFAAMRNAWPAMVTLVEGVLERHRTSRIWPDICFRCQVKWPCADIAAVMAVLDTLDPP